MKLDFPWKKYTIQSFFAVLLSVFVMDLRGAFEAESTPDRIKAICDGFTVTALFYLCFGALLWVSLTGFFDILSYAAKKGLHVFLPGSFQKETGSYYDYKIEKAKGRNPKTHRSILIIGAVFFVISIGLTLLWYQISPTV